VATCLEPSVVPEVEPEEPKGLDAETNECSAEDMKSTKIASFLQETAFPLALVVAPAVTQVACTGTQQQTPSARQADDDSAVELEKRRARNYEDMCDYDTHRGDKCPTREEWDKLMGH
jgi:hypothetical protein